MTIYQEYAQAFASAIEAEPYKARLDTHHPAERETLSIRRAGRERWYDSDLPTGRPLYRFAATGGVLITARVRGKTMPTYGNYPETCVIKRLGPGWTVEQLARTLELAHKQATGTAPDDDLISARNRLQLRFDAIPTETVAHVLSDAIEAAEKETGHTPMYSDMTLDDCAFWQAWLDERGY